MVFVLLNKEGKRIKELNGKVTPAFNFASEAYDYAEVRGMKYYKIKRFLSISKR